MRLRWPRRWSARHGRTVGDDADSSPALARCDDLVLVTVQGKDDAPVVVADRLSKPHPLVVGTRDEATRAKPDETGRLDLGGARSARIKVSRTALPRALRVLDAICKAAAARGWEVVADKTYSGRPTTKVRHGHHDVDFTITEETDREPHVPNKGEQARIEQGYGYGVPEWDYAPSGRLRLRLVECYTARRGSWGDGVRQRVDDLLTQVLDEVAYVFEEEDRRAAEREREERERVALQKVALEDAYQRLAHDRRVSAVERQVQNWRLAHDLRRYAEEVRTRLAMSGEQHEPTLRWLAWVQRYLDEVLDPPSRCRSCRRTPSPPTRQCRTTSGVGCPATAQPGSSGRASG